MERNARLIAADLVADERTHQVELGFDADHDDQHGFEELGAAAAYFLLPSWMNRDVCLSEDGNSLRLAPLAEVIGEGAWDGIAKTYDDPETNLNTRIKNLVKGVALGMAELERLLRMRGDAEGR